MKVDCGLAGLEDVGPRALDAERTGYSGAWTIELNHDPFLPLAVAATATSSLELGTAIAVAFARSPMTTAYTAYDLQRMSEGRFLLGLGSQVKAHITRRFSMPWGVPAPQMREFVLALRAIWSSWVDGTPLAFEGEYYRHTLMPPNFVPEPHGFGRPRVFLAGVGEGMTRVAGEVADGFLCHGFTTERYLRERTLPALQEGQARRGPTGATLEVTGGGFVATGNAEEIDAALVRIRSQIAFYGSTPAYRGVLELHGWEGLGAELTALSKQNRWDEMSGLVDDELLEAFAVVGPPDELPARIAARFGGILTRLSFRAPASMDRDAVAALVAELRALPAG
jgi:probable F420-dependent oxidoreductase